MSWNILLMAMPIIAGMLMSFLGEHPLERLYSAATGIGLISIFEFAVGWLFAYENIDSLMNIWIMTGIGGMTAAVILAGIAFLVGRLTHWTPLGDTIFD